MFTTAALAAVLAATAATPTEVVKRGNDAVQAIIATGGDDTVQRLAAKADDFVDFGELAKRALGKTWDELNAKQRQEFSTTMKELLRASYAQKAVGQGRAKVDYGRETVTGNEAEVVTTLHVQKDRIPVVYRLYRKDAKSPWRIYDVVTDEVSLMETYAGQFRKLIAQRGYKGLLETLQRKRDQLEAQIAGK